MVDGLRGMRYSVSKLTAYEKCLHIARKDRSIDNVDVPEIDAGIVEPEELKECGYLQLPTGMSSQECLVRHQQ